MRWSPSLNLREAFLLALKSYRQNKEEEALAVFWYDNHWVQRAAQLDDDLVALCRELDVVRVIEHYKVVKSERTGYASSSL